MKMVSRYIKIMLLIISFNPGISKSQTLPVGTPVLEDYYRRAQLLGKLDPNISFTVRPLYSSKSLNANNIFDPDSALEKSRDGNFNGIYRFWGKFGKIQLLPFTWVNQYTTHHPYSINDGAMIPARGYQTLFSSGIYAKFGPLSFQVRPEIVYAENRAFHGFYKEHPDNVWKEYYRMLNAIELPERFGNNTYKRFFLGQSHISLALGPFSIGISSENLWWGPGIRNSLMMSNSAPGFNYFTLNSTRPLNTPVGLFECRIIGGKLENSGFALPDTNRTFEGNILYSAKRDEWRYINGIILSYKPKWVNSLFLGVTRTFLLFNSDLKNKFKNYFPIITPIDKRSNYAEGESMISEDQRASIFFRWIWLKENAEIYGEFFREDHAFNMRDFFLEPDYEHAYLFGIKRIFRLNNRTNRFLELNIELTQLAQTTPNPERLSQYVYVHFGELSQGYTHKGQLLGPGIGPGSNLQTISLSWNRNLQSLGLECERFVHNYDLYTAVIKDIRANWVDFNISLFGHWNYKNWLFFAKMAIIRSYNYQFLYRPDAGSSPSFWNPGKDVYNYQGNISVTYRF